MTSIALLDDAGDLPRKRLDGRRLVEQWLHSHKRSTLRCYQGDLRHFAAWGKWGTAGDALQALLQRGQGGANEVVLDYREHLLSQGLAPATVNRRLAAVRSVVKAARLVGAVNWDVLVPGVRAERYKDTLGPGRDGYIALLKATPGPSAVRTRDRAVLHLLYDMALRRAEVASLRLEDWDVVGARAVLWVVRKGSTERVARTVPAPTRRALEQWLRRRGTDPGQLLVLPGRGHLSDKAVYRAVLRAARRAGIVARPHGLRHASITEALERTGGDVRRVRHFSGHRSLDTLLVYDDMRRDAAGEVADLVAEDVPD